MIQDESKFVATKLLVVINSNVDTVVYYWGYMNMDKAEAIKAHSGWKLLRDSRHVYL